jgi:hypothetical protein
MTSSSWLRGAAAFLLWSAPGGGGAAPESTPGQVLAEAHALHIGAESEHVVLVLPAGMKLGGGGRWKLRLDGVRANLAPNVLYRLSLGQGGAGFIGYLAPYETERASAQAFDLTAALAVCASRRRVKSNKSHGKLAEAGDRLDLWIVPQGRPKGELSIEKISLVVF